MSLLPSLREFHPHFRESRHFADADSLISDTLLRHLKKLHDAVDTERPYSDASMEIFAESAIESRGSKATEPAIEPSLLVNGSNMTSEEDIYQIIDDMTIQDAADTNDISPQPILDLSKPTLDQSWWLDYEFDPNSLDMSLFEPMAFPELFSQHNSAFEDSQLLSREMTLPGQEIEKAWFTHVNDSRNSDIVGQQSSTPVKNGGSYELDEEFRLRACQRLKKRLDVDPLPSTGLLVSSNATLTMTPESD